MGIAEEQTQGEKEKEPQLDEKLRAVLTKRFGENWRRHISVTMRADVFWWILRLALWGLEVREKELKAKPRDQRDMGEVMSLGSWQMDLEEFVEAISKGEEVKFKRKKK